MKWVRRRAVDGTRQKAQRAGRWTTSQAGARGGAPGLQVCCFAGLVVVRAGDGALGECGLDGGCGGATGSTLNSPRCGSSWGGGSCTGDEGPAAAEHEGMGSLNSPP